MSSVWGHNLENIFKSLYFVDKCAIILGMYDTFGKNLRRIREERGLSQDELAAIVGTSKQVISKYETIQRTPKVSIAAEFARRLNVPLSQLTGTDDKQPLKIPPILNDVQVAFSGGAGDGLEQADIEMLVDIAKGLKKKNENRDDKA